MNKRIEEAYAKRPRRWVFELVIALITVALLIWSGTAVETSGTTQNGAKIAWNILAGIFHPDTGLLFNLTTQGVPYLLLETICIAFLGTVVGAVISIPLAFLSASNLTPAPVAFIGRLAIMAIRTVSGLCLWADVHPCDRTGRLRRTSDHVPLLRGNGKQDVYRSHRGSGYKGAGIPGCGRLHVLAEDPLWNPAPAYAEFCVHCHLPL